MYTEFNELITGKFTQRSLEDLEPILGLKLTSVNSTSSLKFRFCYCYLVSSTAGCIFCKSHSGLDILQYHLELSSNE